MNYKEQFFKKIKICPFCCEILFNEKELQVDFNR